MVEPLQDSDFETRLDSLFQSVDQLPTLPQILLEIQAQLNDAQSGAAELALAIETDPSVTANVLHLANSAFYGFSKRFASVKEAVILVGRREVERLVSATALIDTFKDSGGTMDYAEFWAHSLRAAEATEFISTHHFETSPYGSNEAYLGGLLHDCGKLILNQFLPDDWTNVRTYAETNDCTDWEAERAILGIDHGEIAARLLELWALAPSLIEGTRWHHRVSKCGPDYKNNAELIAFSDMLCHAYEQDELPERQIPHALFSLDENQVELLSSTLDTATERAELLLS